MIKKMAVLIFIMGTAVFFYRNLQNRPASVETPDSTASEPADSAAAALPSNKQTPEKHTAPPSQNMTRTLPEATNQTQNRQIGLGQFDAYAHFQMGNYEGAVSLLRALIKQFPADELVRKNLATALLALGFFKLQKKEIAEAESAFDESARLGNADARKALAALKLRQGQIETARELLEDISKAGADPESYKILIDLALSQDEIERADDLLNRMNESLLRSGSTTQQPVSPDLTSFIEVRRKRLEQKRNFLKVQDIVSRQGIEVSYSTPDLRSNAETVARAMENVMVRLSQLLGPLPAHARLRAWLVPTNDFNSSTGAPAWAAAVFDGYIRIPVGRTTNGKPLSPDTLERLAQHETTHAYMYAFCGELLPSWIGEGLALSYEGRSVQQSTSEILRTAGRKGLQSFEPEMENLFTLAPPKLIGRLYARSHLIVNSMSREGGGVGQTWQRVLSAVCVQRRPLPDVLQEQFSAGTLTELWARYFPPAGEPQ